MAHAHRPNVQGYRVTFHVELGSFVYALIAHVFHVLLVQRGVGVNVYVVLHRDCLRNRVSIGGRGGCIRVDVNAIKCVRGPPSRLST